LLQLLFLLEGIYGLYFNIETLTQSQGKPLFLLAVLYFKNEIGFVKRPV